ncbi:glutamate-1-semialdehyde 2,1-aminomutase [Enteractinococcus fodinae]|uniref:Glutamate-1-semialdehyde 2,1-aminomutase n=1 Tax=Enteractinococcus fodinae TaxID=684663 RepID=A0ABU2AZA1_9MICC|nr:glutamate-1-semialdehyde 2,1-aminomutase [Enteractinococcus fodinae]MDR7346678.1 glutamate-1-semialdehyde 2,1-aminomutase [Enteractinococcus fodinae]
MTTNQQAFDTARAIIPGGVNSPVRGFGSVGGTPAAMVKATGPYLTDVEDNTYVDLVGSWGPMLLGHNHPAVVEAVHQAVDAGLSFGTSTPSEARLAELIAKIMPVERVRFVSTGTEATMTAIRLARGATGRNLIIKFAGCYHGHSDGLLAAAGSGLATHALPDSAGVPEAVTSQTLVLPYNDEEAVKQAFEAYPDQIAGIITESAPANMGVVPPKPGFNKFLRDITTQHGAVFIMDEVLTGFRASAQGGWGLESAAWTPDLFTFGKVIGGGLPVASVAGSAAVMDLLAPVGPVYQAGTLSGNPIAMAAGYATLTNATDEVYETITQRSTQLQAMVTEALQAEGVNHSIQNAGSLFSITFGTADTPVVDYATAQAQEAFRYGPFFHAMLDGGVYLAPSVFEAWFVSAAHDDKAMNKIAEALPAAAKAAAAATA